MDTPTFGQPRDQPSHPAPDATPTETSTPGEQPSDPVATLRKRARILDRLLDDRGRLTRWPVRRAQQVLALEHIAAQIEEGRTFTEREIGRVLDDLHAFHDVARLRRELVELGLLQRRRDGSAYWKPSPSAECSEETQA